MNRETLTYLAKQAALMSPMVAAYPDPKNKDVTFPPSPYYRFLKLLSETMQSGLSVELGVCGGGGSLHLAMGSKQVVGVDIDWIGHEANLTWLVLRYPHFIFLEMDSIKAADYIEKWGSNHGQKIDVLFVDTTHTYDQTMAELAAYRPLLSDKAVICLDDLYRDGMDRVWAEMGENKIRFDYLHPSQSPTDGGFGVIWR